MTATERPVLEKVVDEAVKRRIQARGGHSIKTTGVKIVGTPDRLGCYRGRMLAWEIKRKGGKATPLQLHRLEEWKRAGAHTAVIDDADHVDAMLDDIDREVGW